jgi:hypothetical protein
MFRRVIRGECSYYGAAELFEVVKEKGEAFSFEIEEGEIRDFLKKKGFVPIAHYMPHRFEARYLYDDQGEFFGNMYGFACHVHALC